MVESKVCLNKPGSIGKQPEQIQPLYFLFENNTIVEGKVKN